MCEECTLISVVFWHDSILSNTSLKKEFSQKTIDMSVEGRAGSYLLQINKLK